MTARRIRSRVMRMREPARAEEWVRRSRARRRPGLARRRSVGVRSDMGVSSGKEPRDLIPGLWSRIYLSQHADAWGGYFRRASPLNLMVLSLARTLSWASLGSSA